MAFTSSSRILCGPGEPPEFSSDALNGAAGLRVRIEEVAGDEVEVDLLGDGEVHRGAERGELALTLDGGPLPEIRVPRTQVDVGRVKQPQHRTGVSSCAPRPRYTPDPRRHGKSPQDRSARHTPGRPGPPGRADWAIVAESEVAYEAHLKGATGPASRPVRCSGTPLGLHRWPCYSAALPVRPRQACPNRRSSSGSAQTSPRPSASGLNPRFACPGHVGAEPAAPGGES